MTAGRGNNKNTAEHISINPTPTISNFPFSSPSWLKIFWKCEWELKLWNTSERFLRYRELPMACRAPCGTKNGVLGTTMRLPCLVLYCIVFVVFHGQLHLYLRSDLAWLAWCLKAILLKSGLRLYQRPRYRYMSFCGANKARISEK